MGNGLVKAGRRPGFFLRLEGLSERGVGEILKFLGEGGQAGKQEYFRIANALPNPNEGGHYVGKTPVSWEQVSEMMESGVLAYGETVADVLEEMSETDKTVA